MRICFIDLLFCWPPRGGADVDTYNILANLNMLGYKVLLITIKTKNLTRGNILKNFDKFSVHLIEVEELKSKILPTIRCELLKIIEDYSPKIIIVGNSFFLKPVVTLWLKGDIPIVWRQYAYELICQKGIQRFRNNSPCNLDYLSSPDFCRNCFLTHSKNSFLSYSIDPWLEEYLSVRAYSNSYYHLLKKAISKVKTIWVYSQSMKNIWGKYHQDVKMIPGGVDVNLFYPIEKTEATPTNFRILASGRIQDESKGLSTLLSACESLRKDFPHIDLMCTSPWQPGYPSWVKFIGWHSYYELPKVYQHADICVVPSIWEEPFGLVTLEAMASGIPVVASEIGGLKEIIIDGKTGLLFAPGNPESLKNKIRELLTNPQPSLELSREARSYVVSNYSWDKIAQDYYAKEIKRILQSE